MKMQNVFQLEETDLKVGEVKHGDMATMEIQCEKTCQQIIDMLREKEIPGRIFHTLENGYSEVLVPVEYAEQFAQFACDFVNENHEVRTFQGEFLTTVFSEQHGGFVIPEDDSDMKLYIPSIHDLD